MSKQKDVATFDVIPNGFSHERTSVSASDGSTRLVLNLKNGIADSAELMRARENFEFNFVKSKPTITQHLLLRTAQKVLTFEYSSKDRAFILSSLQVVRDPIKFSDIAAAFNPADGFSDESGSASLVNAVNCNEDSKLGSVIRISEEESAAQHVRAETKIASSCGEKVRWISSTLGKISATAGANKSKSYLSCISDSKPYSMIRNAILETGSPSLKITCDENEKSRAELNSKVVQLGRDVNSGVEMMIRENILMHELLHSVTALSHEDISNVISCCGGGISDSKACAKLPNELRNQENVVADVSDKKDEQSGKNENASTTVVKAAQIDSPVLPRKVNIQVGAADNIERIKPTLAKYSGASRAIAAAGNVIQKFESSLIPTARAATGASQSNDDGSVTYEANSSDSFAMNNGQSAQFILPFDSKSETGIGSLQVKVSGSPKAGMKPLSVKAVSASLGKANVGSVGAAENADSVSSESRGVSGKPRAASLDSAGTGTGARDVATAVGGTSGGSAPGTLPQVDSSRGLSGTKGTQGIDVPSKSTDKPKKWTDARKLLSNAPDPVQMMSEDWFQPFLKERQIFFKGDPYGPPNKVIWNLDPFWKPTK